MILRIAFTLFPVVYWILIGIGISLHFFPRAVQFGNILINLGSFLLALRVAVIIHEIGHLVAAKMAGGHPRRIVLGKGYEVYRKNIFGISVIINSKFRGGHAWASFDNLKFLKLRYAFYILGGMAANVLVALLIYITFDFGINLEDPRDQISIVIAFTFFLANVLMLFNFIPAHATIQGIRVPTDGLALFHLPFKKIKEIRQTLDNNMLIDGHEHLENKEYEKALAIFTGYLTQYPETKILSLNIAHIFLKIGEPLKAITESSQLLAEIDDKMLKPYSAVIYNHLAWTYLVLNDIEEADRFSALAIELMPGDQNIQGTRGSVLVEKGMTDRGMSLLFANMDFRFVDSGSLCAAIYLMLGSHLNGVMNERQRYLEFVKTNADKLEPDEKILFERNLSRIELAPAIR
jgi:tetratricopeptide (TPR) repeat protein